MEEHQEDLDTLGEQLYSVIYSKHKEDAGKLTGEETCLTTVQWPKWLVHFMDCIEGVFGVWFRCVYVAGMLLELPVPVITRILQDEAVLTAAVDKALGALQVAQESRFCNTSVIYSDYFVSASQTSWTFQFF